jgi:ribonuclease HI
MSLLTLFSLSTGRVQSNIEDKTSEVENYQPFLWRFRLLKRKLKSDSLNSLQAIESIYSKSNPILTEIQVELAEIGEMKTVKFVWTLGHAGIRSNERADERAKKL